jgi:hypothetical protein
MPRFVSCYRAAASSELLLEQICKRAHIGFQSDELAHQLRSDAGSKPNGEPAGFVLVKTGSEISGSDCLGYGRVLCCSSLPKAWNWNWKFGSGSQGCGKFAPCRPTILRGNFGSMPSRRLSVRRFIQCVSKTVASAGTYSHLNPSARSNSKRTGSVRMHRHPGGNPTGNWQS